MKAKIKQTDELSEIEKITKQLIRMYNHPCKTRDNNLSVFVWVPGEL